MKKLLVVLGLGLGLLTSCEQEPCYATTYFSDGSWAQTEVPCDYYYSQDDVNLSLNVLPLFVGEYLNDEVYINGELSDTCDTTWNFTSTTVLVARVESCDEFARGKTSGYTFDDTTLYIGQATNTGVVLIEYAYTEASNGDLTLTTLTGNYTLTYKLKR
tara:strand:- start:5894 stop:6370 length:477 start_codon:yes stop_codon:yes gene_type:complete